MAGRAEPLVYLDTHIVIWLYAGLQGKLTGRAREAIEGSDLRCCQISRLEIQYLHEIGRITVGPEAILKELSRTIGLKASPQPLREIVDEAFHIRWTRDVFDRLLAAEVILTDSALITADRELAGNLDRVIW